MTMTSVAGTLASAASLFSNFPADVDTSTFTAKQAEYFEKFCNMLVRTSCDLRKKSPFRRLPEALLGADISKLEQGDPIAHIDRVAAAAEEHDVVIKSGMCPAVLEYHGKYHLGFFDKAVRMAGHNDPDASEDLILGATCIGPCRCPPSWPAHSRRRPETISTPLPHNIHNFSDDAGPPAGWSDEEILEVYNQTKAETEVEPLLRHARLRPPISFTEAVRRGWRNVWRRFGCPQRNKIRMIDPACDANARSNMERSVEMASGSDILAASTMAQQPDLAKYNVVAMSRKRVKEGRSLEKRYEDAFVKYVEQGTPIPADLLKEAHQFEHNASASGTAGSSRSSGSSKRRRLDSSIFIQILMLIIDVHKAYNSVCVRKSHRKYNRFAVYNPHTKLWEFYQSDTLTFGNVHSVVAWCRISAAMRSLALFFIGIMISVYVDDFPAPVPAHLAEKAMKALLHLFNTVGFAIHPDKARFGSPMEVLGLVFDVASRTPNFFISLERKNLLQGMISRALDSCSLSTKEAEVLRGKLMFCLSALVDRQFSPILKPLTQYINLPRCSRNGFSDRLAQCLRNISTILDRDVRKFTKLENPWEDNQMVYTDAAYSHNSGWLSAVLVRGRKFVVRRIKVHASEILQTKRSSPINFLELVATVAALFEFRPLLLTHFFRISVDNDAAKNALLNQSSPVAEMATGALFFWSTCSKLLLTPWVDRVPTGYNCADVPTRPEFLQFVLTNFPGLFDDIQEFGQETKALLPDMLNLTNPEKFGVMPGVNLSLLFCRSAEVDPCLNSIQGLDLD